MSELKALFHSARIKNEVILLDVDAVSKHPDGAFETLRKYVKADIKWCQNAHLYLYAYPPPKPKKQKHCSIYRTVSIRKWAGCKKNKPKYNWSKKRKALAVVWLG